MATEIQWTQSQLDAIEAPCNKILVSAAAGSGKSTVLTQRIITAHGRKARDTEFTLPRIFVIR